MEFGINITDPTFGGPINGDWSPAFQNAINTVAINASYSGGLIFVPRGNYTLKSSITISTLESDLLASITIEGEGMHSTILDFNNQGSGLIVEHGTFVKLRGFYIKGSIDHNILIKTGANHVELTNLRSSFAAKSGVTFERSFLITMRDVFASHNTWHGFEFQGFHTSVHGVSCFAASNHLDGWVINDMVYSSFNSCAADKNRKGWSISNIRSVKLTGCGCESNSQAGFYVHAPASTIVINDVENLSMESCFGTNNNTGGGFSNFLYIQTTLAGKVSVVMKNCSDLDPPAGSSSVVIDGTGARLIDDNNIFQFTIEGVNGGIKTLVQYSREIGPIAVIGPNTDILQLGDIFNSTDTFGGILTIEARNNPLSVTNSNSATYVLLVSKTVTSTSVTILGKSGLTQGTGISWPSFDFSINANGKLEASPVASTNGSFYFQISASGNIALY